MSASLSGTALVARGVFAALFPADCRLCGTPLQNISRLPVCDLCISAARPISSETCSICGEALGHVAAISDELRLCGACLDSRPSFAKAVAYGAYEGEVRDLIHLLKYDRVLPAAEFLGELLARAATKLKIEGDVLVIPVPLHSSKRRQRCFNQAELIGRIALKKLDFAQARFAPEALVRVRATGSQIGLTRSQRLENIRGAFQVAHPTRVEGRNVLLLDDVLTTGTTVSECARVLRKAGAKDVWVATVARTLKIAAPGFAEERFEAQAV